MSDWQQTTLKDVCKIITGNSIPKKIKEELFTNVTGMPYVATKDVGFDGRIDYSNGISIPETHLETFKISPKDATLVCAEGGSAGRKIAFSEKECCFVNKLFSIIPISDVLPKFLFFYTKGVQFQSQFESALSGLIGGVSLSKVKKFKIGFPSLPEQERIVAILDEAFEAIDTAIANTEKNLANARELFESCLLHAIRSVGETSTLFTLKEISSDFGRGKSKHRPRNDKTLYGGEYPFVQTGDVRAADHVLHTFSQSYNEKGLAQSKLWPKGTVCITIAANIAETAILGMDACFPDSVIGVVPNPDHASPDYVEYLLQGFSAELKAEGEGTAQDNINLATFKDRKFPFPSPNGQLACVNRLDSVRSSVRQLQQNLSTNLTNLQELKQSILQKAFTGELTVSAEPMLQDARL
jgi:type I restriction enzyme S subunit